MRKLGRFIYHCAIVPRSAIISHGGRKAADARAQYLRMSTEQQQYSAKHQLQIRLVCELIALCCLVVHGDIDEAKGPIFQKQWSTPELLKGLEALNPHFYPTPAVPQATGPGSWHFADFDGDYLTKEKLPLPASRQSQEHTTGKQMLMAEMTDVIDAHRAICGLLNVRRISLLTEAGQFVYLMDGGGGQVKTLLAFPSV